MKADLQPSHIRRRTAVGIAAGTALVTAALVMGSLWLTGSLGRGGEPTAVAAPPRTETVTVTATVTEPPPSPTVETTTTEDDEYPKLVDASTVDSRFTAYLDVEQLVQLAPGVYAEPPASGELGDLDDYSSYLGLCVDVKRYAETHPGGHTCW